MPQQQSALLVLVPVLSLCEGPLRLGALGHDALHGPFGLHPLPSVSREEIGCGEVLTPAAAPFAAVQVTGWLWRVCREETFEERERIRG